MNRTLCFLITFLACAYTSNSMGAYFALNHLSVFPYQVHGRAQSQSDPGDPFQSVAVRMTTTGTGFGYIGNWMFDTPCNPGGNLCVRFDVNYNNNPPGFGLYCVHSYHHFCVSEHIDVEGCVSGYGEYYQWTNCISGPGIPP